MSLDVVGFGALNLDKLFKVNMIAKEEEEASVLDFKESGGGSAANTGTVAKSVSAMQGFLMALSPLRSLSGGR